MIKRFFKHFYYSMKLRNKLVLSYLVLFGLWIAIFIFGSYQQSVKILQEQIETSVSQILEQSQLNIEYRMREMEGISNIIFGNAALQEIISRSETADRTLIQQYEDFEALQSFTNTLTSNYGTYKFKFFINSNTLYSNEHVTFFPQKDIVDEIWYEDVLKREGGLYWLGLAHPEYPGEEECISAIRVLKDLKMEYGKKIGVLKIDMVERDIVKILDNIKISNNAEAFLIDSSGIILSAKHKGLRGNSINGEIKSGLSGRVLRGIFRIGSGMDEKLVIYREIGNYGWKLIAVIPYREVVKDIAMVRNNNIFVLLVMLLVSVIIVLVFSESFIRRIRNITKRMANIENGNFNETIPTIYNDELGLIENKFNEMSVKVRNLLKDIYHSEAKKREAELKALQAQINPHFLYNTLDTINWMAVDKGVLDISSIVSALGRFFRLSLSGGEEVISIRDEIEQTRLYLYIQQIRFKNQIQVEYRKKFCPLQQ